MHKRIRYKIALQDDPSRWIVAEKLKVAVDDAGVYNHFFFIRELHGLTLEEFRTTTSGISIELIEIELAKKDYTTTAEE